MRVVRGGGRIEGLICGPESYSLSFLVRGAALVRVVVVRLAPLPSPLPYMHASRVPSSPLIPYFHCVKGFVLVSFSRLLLLPVGRVACLVQSRSRFLLFPLL